MEAQGLNPMGFVATDYATLIWGLEAVGDAVPLFSRENLRETMETWLADNAVMKRTFKGSAIIAGLIDRAMPGGKRKTGRQAAFSSDILYDTLRKYDPDHVMLEITRPRRCAASSISGGSRRCWNASAGASTMCA
jgi:ATP-dependent Lhr-like helicase